MFQYINSYSVCCKINTNLIFVHKYVMFKSLLTDDKVKLPGTYR